MKGSSALFYEAVVMNMTQNRNVAKVFESLL